MANVVNLDKNIKLINIFVAIFGHKPGLQFLFGLYLPWFMNGSRPVFHVAVAITYPYFFPLSLHIWIYLPIFFLVWAPFMVPARKAKKVGDNDSRFLLNLYIDSSDF